MQVKCDVENTELAGDYGGSVEGVCVTCKRCKHQVEVFGMSEASVRRGLATMRNECPRGENNFYVRADE